MQIYKQEEVIEVPDSTDNSCGKFAELLYNFTTTYYKKKINLITVL